MKKNFLFGIGSLAVASCLLSACVDSKYDVNNMDMTIGSTSDLALPSLSTDSILLKNIMDLGDDDIIKVQDGEFRLVTSGQANMTETEVNEVTISKPNIESIHTDVQLNANSGSARYRAVAGVPDKTFTYTIKDQNNAFFEVKEKSNVVSEDLIGLDALTFEDNVVLKSDLSLTFGNDGSFVKKIHLQNLSLSTPKDIFFKKAELSYQEGGKSKTIQVGIDNGTINISGNDGVVIDASSPVSLSLTLDKAKVSGNGLIFADKKIEIDGMFKFNGTFAIKSEEFEGLSNAQIQQIQNNGLASIIPQSIKFDVTSAFNDKISVAKIDGLAQKVVSESEPIMLDNMPNFLKDESVKIVLNNPSFIIEWNNPFPAGSLVNPDATAAAGNLTIESIKGDEVIARKLATLSGIPSGKSILVLADAPATAEVPARYASYNRINVVVENLNELLMTIPDKICINFAPVTIALKDLVPGQYNTQVDYCVDTPLEFLGGSKLIYEDVEDVEDDMDDASDFDAKAIEIQANVVTNLPMDLTLSVDALDRNGRSLKGGVIDVNDVVVGAHKGDVSETTTQAVVINITPREGHSIRELLQNMAKFVYRAEFEGEGKLYENASIKLTNVKATIKGGIVYDAN